MKTKFTENCADLLNSLPAHSPNDVNRLAHRLSRAINRLDLILSQANAQFKVGDRPTRHFYQNFHE